MEMDESQKPLKIPANASDRDDYIQGIGSKEVAIILTALFIIIVSTITFSIISGNIVVSVLFGFFLIGITIVTVKRDVMNENLIDKLRILIHYLWMQKIYFYAQYDVFQMKQGVDDGEE